MGRLFWFGIAFVLGIGLEPFWQPQSFVLFIAMVAIFLLSLFSKKSGEFGLVVLVFLLGTLRIAALDISEFPEEGHFGGRVVFSTGKTAIIENASNRLEGTFYSNAPPLGSLVVVWYQGKPKISQLKGSKDHSRIAQRSRVVQRKIKDWNFVLQPTKQVKPPELTLLENGGLIWTFISGEIGDLDTDTKSLMRETGTSHLMAISGLHIGLVSGLVYWIARVLLIPLFLVRLEQTATKLPLLAAIMFAWFYGNQVGWPPSAQRAVIMVGLFSVGKFFEISISLGDCLGLAAVIILFREPSEFHSLSFQLSFSAVLGIALFLPKFQSIISKDWHPLTKKILLSMGVTVGANLGTLPLVGWYFQEFAWVGLFTNLVVMPLMASVAVPFSLVGALLPESFSLFCFCLADVSIDISLRLLQMFQAEPIVVAFNILDMTLCAMLIFCMRWRLWLGFLFLLAPYYPTEKVTGLEVRFLAIGQGDASLIRWDDGRDWLVDGGAFSFELVPYLRREGIQKLDRVIVSHAHPDHFGGLFLVLEKLEVQKLIVSRFPEKNEKQYEELLLLAAEKNIEIQMVDNWDDKGVTLFHPINWRAKGKHYVNEESIVFTAEYGKHRFLFTGDIEEQAEQYLENVIGDIDVLKVAHHGSRTSSSPKFISEVQPEFSVISSGIDNRFGHPHRETLYTLRDSKILRTDRLGTIVFRSDGENLSWEVE